MSFNGNQKKGMSILGKAEIKLKNKLFRLVPKKVETYHLILTTILWSPLIILFGFFASYYSLYWLWGISLLILLQYLSSLLGNEARRNKGLITWGYYASHFLDYIFLCSILISYSILLPDEFKYPLFLILALFAGFLINTHLIFAVTNEFKISYMGIGPTEIRLLFVLINTSIILFGKTYLSPALPFILALTLLGLCITVYKTQKHIWNIDKRKK